MALGARKKAEQHEVGVCRGDEGLAASRSLTSHGAGTLRVSNHWLRHLLV